MECSHSYSNNRVPFGYLNKYLHLLLWPLFNALSYLCDAWIWTGAQAVRHRMSLFWILWEPFTFVDVFCASSKLNYPMPQVELWFFFVWPVIIICSIHQKIILYVSSVISIWILWDCSSHASFYLWLHIFCSCSICSTECYILYICSRSTHFVYIRFVCPIWVVALCLSFGEILQTSPFPLFFLTLSS